MPNRFNSKIGRDNMNNPGRKSDAASAPTAGTPMKVGPFKGSIGPTGPKRDTMGVKKIKQHTQDIGI